MTREELREHYKKHPIKEYWYWTNYLGEIVGPYKTFEDRANAISEYQATTTHPKPIPFADTISITL
jgi:hypothetical protein